MAHCPRAAAEADRGGSCGAPRRGDCGAAERAGEAAGAGVSAISSKLDPVEMPFYPDDFFPKMRQLLAILNGLDHRYETDRYNLQSWLGPRQPRNTSWPTWSGATGRTGSGLKRALKSCTGSVANSVEKRGMDKRWLGGSAPDNCLLTASEQYQSVVSHETFLPLPRPLFGAAFCL